MKFSESWLREWVNPDIDSAELMSRLTMAGLEVDGSEAVAGHCNGVVVARVESVEPHPDADKLSLCQVNDGEDNHQVVCGAPNVRPGLLAPFARIGAELSTAEGDKPFKIKKAKLRGVESRGMLCSAEELGLAESSDGLLELPDSAPLGSDIRDFLDLDDLAIELDLTPNRSDCLGMLGIAREVGVLTRSEVCQPGAESAKVAIEDAFPIQISAAEACPRYLGRIIRNIDVSAESPLWMQEKLRRAGLRSIDPVVDVTNFVLLELGQPMHAFDFARLQGHIEVRMATAGEKLTLLDGKEVELNPEVLVIADADKAVAMAGIMGGEYSAVNSDTRDVFLECAFFAPLAIAGKARQFGMHTDASHRYERGVDYELQALAMERATVLLLDIVGGEAGPVVEATGKLPQAPEIDLRLANIRRLLGIDMAVDEVRDILARLGLDILQQKTDAIRVRVPSFRFDLAIEADLIEELARVYGYNNIPRSRGLPPMPLQAPTEQLLPLPRLRRHLASLGYQEVINYSFVDPQWQQAFCGEGDAIALQNPLSEDLSVMRRSILPGLLKTLQYNRNRQQARLRLFETGLVFHRQQGHGEGETQQPTMLAGLVSGSRYPENWSQDKEISDFYDVKGDLESLLEFGAKADRFSFRQGREPGFHPGRCAEILAADGRRVGVLGALHPQLQRDFELDSEVLLFELELDAVLPVQLPSATDLSKFPEVTRDLAILVDQDRAAGDILRVVRENAGEYLADLRLFDVYQGDAITKNKKSLALGLTWQHPSRTLSDDEVNAIISSCVNALQEQFNANLRD